MTYRPEFYPEDWKQTEGPFAKAFIVRDASALRQPALKRELMFKRLCLAHADFEDARYAAECLANWGETGSSDRDASIMQRPEHLRVRRNLLLRTCYETTMTVAYARPFTTARGLPKIGFTSIGLTPRESTTELHDKLIKYRQKWFAHSDPEVRRFIPPALVEMRSSSGESFERMSNPIFPRGGIFGEAQVHQIDAMILEIQNAIRDTMIGMSSNLEEPLRRSIPADLEGRN